MSSLGNSRAFTDNENLWTIFSIYLVWILLKGQIFKCVSQNGHPSRIAINNNSKFQDCHPRCVTASERLKALRNFTGKTI